MSKYRCLDPRRWLNTVADFARCHGGNYAIIFALSLVPTIGLVGAAIDYSRAAQMRERLQVATDAASLAVNKMIGIMSDEEIRDYARDMLNANLAGLEGVNLDSIEVVEEDNMVTIGASTSLDTSMLGILGIDEIDVSVEAQTVYGTGRFEVALVLDNSGSMSGSRITNLRNAATELVETMFDEADDGETVRIGVVPFAASVNVGPHLRNAEWIDGDGVSSTHHENFDTDSVTRFDLYDAMDDVSWGGCVEARPYPLDVTDVAPSAGNPDSYFVPWFAPDEPDRSKYGNSYLDDDGGSCTVDKRDLNNRERQELTCKYDDEDLNPWSSRGPNYLCTTDPLTPLSTNESTLLSAISAMGANGSTNIHEGVMWGWRILSPSAPFTNGRAYTEEDNRKIMVLMTDGQNWHNGRNNHNRSDYSAYGFSANGRLRSPTSSDSRLRQAMNARTTEACGNAKNAGITIYTIAFDIRDRDTRDMLEGCANSAQYAFNVENTSELLAAFRQITKEISMLRLSR